MSDFLKVYGPITLLVAASFWFAYQFVDPAPPRSLTLATGSAEGAYHAFGERFKALLAKDGIEVRLLNTAGSVDNMAQLGATEDGDNTSPRVDIAFVQSGIGSPEESPGLVSLGSLYFEPLWIFARGQERPRRLTELAGKRLAVGAEGSGTRNVALQLLAANGIGDGQTTDTELLPLGGKAAAEALIAGDVDAAFFVTAHENPNLQQLFAAADVHLMTFERAAAYERRFRHLSKLPLPEGVLDLAANRPDETLHLLSPVATLVAREDFHPALVDLMLRAASRIHGASGLFQEPGQFPSPLYVDFPLSEEAERFYKSGLPFLRRVLPFWAATIVERLWVMILPILTLMIPLLRIAPPTYRWQIRRRIVRWYRDLIAIEEKLAAAARDDDRGAYENALAAVERLQDEVGRVSVPLAYTADLYQLRTHIDFVRRRFSAMGQGPAHGPVDITA